MVCCAACGGDGKQAELRLDVQGDSVWLYLKAPSGIRGAVALDTNAPLVKQALLEIAELPDQYHACSACEGDGEFERECELRFDIDPGTPATGLSGPPENYDPGCGPAISKIAVFFEGNDVTAYVQNIEAASEYACENWEAPEPDYSDYGPEDIE
jgi:hypothetical protein